MFNQSVDGKSLTFVAFVASEQFCGVIGHIVLVGKATRVNTCTLLLNIGLQKTKGGGKSFYFILFYFTFCSWGAASQKHSKNTHLTHFTHDFIQLFTLEQIASHKLSQLVSHCLASKTSEAKADWERGRGKRAIWSSLVSLQTFFLGAYMVWSKAPCWHVPLKPHGDVSDAFAMTSRWPIPPTQIPCQFRTRYHNIKHAST